MDKEIQYYFTLLGVAFTAIGLLFQFGPNVAATLGVAFLLIIVMTVAGFRLLRRIVHLTEQSALFSSQIGLIRSGFIDLDRKVAPYIMLTTASANKSAHDFIPVSKQLSVRLLSSANSLFAMIAVLLVPTFLYQYGSAAFAQGFWIVVFISSAVIAVVVGGALLRYQRNFSEVHGDRELDALTQSVQQRRRTADTRK
jgi:hypothetical protein